MGEVRFRGGGNSARVKFNIDRIAEKRAELRRLELEEFVVEIPAKSGSGAMADRLQEMAELMLELYNATQNLISASEKMLGEMGGKMEETDTSLAGSY